MAKKLKLRAAGVLAGAYKSKKSFAEQVKHAVSEDDIHVGRLQRKAGEAFCNRKLNLADEYSWDDVSEVDCPRCLGILETLKKTSPKSAVKPAKPRKEAKPAKPAVKAQKPAKGKPAKPKKSTVTSIKKHGYRGLAEVWSLEVEKELRESLGKLQTSLGGKGQAFVFVNKQHHVDAEFRYYLARGESALSIILQMEEILRHEHFRKGLWIVSGVRFPESKNVITKNYDRWKKMLLVQAWPRRAADRHRNFATLRGYMKKLMHKRYRKPEQVYIKFHWNVDDIKPTREELV